jgi:hypothetical protein
VSWPVLCAVLPDQLLQRGQLHTAQHSTDVEKQPHLPLCSVSLCMMKAPHAGSGCFYHTELQTAGKQRAFGLCKHSAQLFTLCSQQ